MSMQSQMIIINIFLTNDKKVISAESLILSDNVSERRV